MRRCCYVHGIAAALSLVLILSGCQTLGTEGLTASEAPSEISEPAANVIAGNMVSHLAEQFVPGTVTLRLNKDGSPFGQALEAALKEKGFPIATDQTTDRYSPTIPIAYAIAPFEEQVLVRLSTNGVDLGRAYTVSAEGAQPVSALSIMLRDKGRA